MSNRLSISVEVKKIRASIYSVVGFLSALLSPVLCILFSFASFLKRRRPSFIGFGLSLSLVYTFLPILWDARNNFLLLTKYGGLTFSPYVISISFLMEYAKFQYMEVIFLFGFVTIYTFSKIIAGRIIENKNYSSQQYYICMVLFFMTLEYRSVFDIQKTTLALALFVVALNAVSPLIRFVFIGLAAITHPFILAIAALMPLAGIFKSLSRNVMAFLFLLAIIVTAASIDIISIAASFMPERVQFYASMEETRFSGEVIAQLVWFLRLVGLTTVAIVTISILKERHTSRERSLLNLLVFSCLLAIVVSRNEIFAERFFLAIVVLTAYIVSVTRFKTRALLFIVLSLGVNVVIHGGYTMYLVFSQKYEVMGPVDGRVNDVAKLFYSPTPVLLDFENGPRSDRAVSHRIK